MPAMIPQGRRGWQVFAAAAAAAVMERQDVGACSRPTGGYALFPAVFMSVMAIMWRIYGRNGCHMAVYGDIKVHGRKSPDVNTLPA
ncbi:MAG: hypothetical protein J0M33_01170 [Anaerolineae bacterium]|nr:hypothetical protein [Anaerolineae bacterium]